jgi:transcriptional regulator with XRE-family HTH domain
LRRARVDAGLTISELAKRAGVSRDTISNAERGRNSLQGPTLSKIAHALGRLPSELLAEEERLSPKAQSRSAREPSFDDLNSVLEDLRRVADFYENLHEIQKALDELREMWEKRLADRDFDKSTIEEAGRTIKAFWPAVTTAADAEKAEMARHGVEPEEVMAQSVLLPAIARFQVLCERVNSTYREMFQTTPSALVYAFPPLREAS